MPTCVSPTIYHLYAQELERRARLRERENDSLEQQNERLLEQIQDLRQFLAEQEERKQRRERRRLGVRGGVYRVIID